MEEIFTYINSPFTVLGLFIVVVLLLITTIILYVRLNKVFTGTNASSLEPLIHECLEKIKHLETEDEHIKDHAVLLDKKMKSSVRNVSTLRFKAFESGASNQSFAISLLDEKGNGVVLSSLHHRDRVTTYAKPVTSYKSSYDLTEEEIQTITESKNAHTK